MDEQIVSQEQPSQEKIGKFKASKLLVKESWNILKQDKEMVLFPVASVFVNLLSIIIVSVFFFFMISGKFFGISDNTNRIIEYLWIFIVYFISFFVTIFFQAGIVSIAHSRLNNQDASFVDGIRVAYSHIGKIALWSLLSATIGVVLNAISEKSKFLGKIVASLLGAAWNLASFFIVPVLILEDISIKESLNKSVAIIRKNWGETLIVNIGMSLYFIVLALAGILVFVVAAFFAKNSAIILGLLALLISYFVLLAIISSTLNVIFKVALYEYANTGVTPKGFSRSLIDMAFKNKA